MWKKETRIHTNLARSRSLRESRLRFVALIPPGAGRARCYRSRDGKRWTAPFGRRRREKTPVEHYLNLISCQFTPMPNKKLLYEKEVYAITGAAMAVYNNLGVGFLEAVYQEAFEIELRKRNIPFESQKSLKIYYQGQELSKTYVADLICYGEIIVELKAISALSKTEEAQLINYLKASGKQVGLLINYGNERKLEWKRYIFTNTTYQTKQNIPEKIGPKKRTPDP